MNINQKKLERSIKIRKWLLYFCIGFAFGIMFLDLSITRNFFKHNDILMLISILSLGMAIYIDSTIKRLRAEKKRLENEHSGN